MTDVQKAEQELELAKLSEEYHEVLAKMQDDPTDELRAQKADLANRIVAIRQPMRQQREAEDAALSNGAGVARPRPVEGSTEVSS